MDEKPERYIPAAGSDWLLPLYDPLLRWIVREDAFKRRLVHEARIGPGCEVLDLGCGTGTLTLLVKHLHAEAKVHGLDGDPKALAIARRKAERAQAEIALDHGLSYELPYPDGSFDRVLSSLLFHHLDRDAKTRTLDEVRRVLKSGGAVHIVDFGKPSTSLGASLARLICRGDHLRDNLEGRMVELLQDAGFSDAEETGRHRALGLSLSFYRGTKRPGHF
jgi:ubiquinone/menaquinone biosynthesis C-methylase UbiE